MVGGIKIGCLSKVDKMDGINIGYSSQQLPFCNTFDTVSISFGGINIGYANEHLKNTQY
jgi:hypothetical protein